ncbi:amidohydrolase family protein [Kangiella sp. HZ709]|uniref:amidohydrolase family protein n=1 Tax=Kangiella sp. HZ709 TaxID=2666328 RepID=UPI0012B156AF|nr:amidohydrolase family protein [Kangiella sp. HZ709]MRX26576.1 amidohydrolase family protein [Kangiella sp. HZ709]
MIRLYILITLFLFADIVSAQRTFDAPIVSEGQGPFNRLILRGGILINGEGAPPTGPVDIIIQGNKILSVRSVGAPGVPIKDSARPQANKTDKVIDITGHYVLPGFVDLHGHIAGSVDGLPAEYPFKLWLAHGITTVREPGSFNGLEWTLKQKKLSDQNKITAPRIIPYIGFGMGWDKPITTVEETRQWVRHMAKKGAKGIKFFGMPKVMMQAALDEAKKQKLGTAMHHAQLNVVGTNALDSARLGLTTMEHWYGLPEAMFEDKVIQDYPLNYNYNDESHRFTEAGRLWQQAAEEGSDTWNAVRDELIELDFTINPTMTIYEASRDVMRERNAEWHQDYTHPKLKAFFEPNRESHGSYFFDWTTQNEIDWKANFNKWMAFLNDYKNHGGRVTVGSDAGYIYKIFGFGYIRELELLQEAGFHPLEVIQSATLNGAEALGMQDKIGSILPGKLADLVIVEENPIANFKVLYGTGHYRLGLNNIAKRVGGVKYTIKDGILYDAKQLREDVKAIVKNAK